MSPEAVPAASITLIRCWNMLAVADAAGGATPTRLAQLLTTALSYQHRRLLRGAEAYDRTSGKHRSVSVERRLLFRYDDIGRVTTFVGFYERIVKLATAQGYAVRYADITPPRANPEWSLLDTSFFPSVTFRPRQQELLGYVVERDYGLFHCTMNFGKSFLFGVIAKMYPKAKIGIVVPGAATARSVFRDLLAFVPMPGLVGDGKRDYQRVTIYLPDSLHHAQNDIDILLVDEVHRVLTATVREKLLEVARTPAKVFLFSGTPKARLDGAESCVDMLAGESPLMRVTYREMVASGVTTPVLVHWLPLCLPSNPLADLRRKDLRYTVGIVQNDARNEAIAKFVRQHYNDPAVQVLISVATVEHAIRLWRYLPEFACAYAGKDLEYFGQPRLRSLLPPSFVPLDTRAQRQLETDFREGKVTKVISTEIWSTGCNFPRLQVLVRADARESEATNLQWSGRPLRLHEGKEFVVMVAILDMWDEGFKRKAYAQYAQYESEGYDQVWPSADALRSAGLRQGK